MNKENQSGDWRSEIKKLESSSGVKDFPLMIKSIVILVLVVVLFFIQSAPFIHADLGFIAFTGEVESLLRKTETLLPFDPTCNFYLFTFCSSVLAKMKIGM